MSDPITRPHRHDFRVMRQVTTRWSDNDVYGHVNNVVYYSWFDTVVNAELIERGVLDPARGETIFVVAETRCRYFASVSFPETISVGIAVERLGETSVTYRLGVFGETGEDAAAAGRFVHVCVTADGRRPVRIPDTVRAALAF